MLPHSKPSLHPSLNLFRRIRRVVVAVQASCFDYVLVLPKQKKGNKSKQKQTKANKSFCVVLCCVVFCCLGTKALVVIKT